MLIKDVAKLSPMDRFCYWIKERHSIYKKRKAGKPKPWTDDEVLQSYFFTNPYRENDKTTVWFRENIRDPLRNKPAVLMATVIFRWFNRITTGRALKAPKLGSSLLLKWDSDAAQNRLEALAAEIGPVFTGAYMIKAGNGPKGCKIGNVCKAIDNVWAQRKRLIKLCRSDCRLEALWQELIKFPHLGGFMSYEIVCDLRYTSLLEDATDVNTWTNLGPGAKRGLARLIGEGEMVRNKRGKLVPRKLPDAVERVQMLLFDIKKKLKGMPRFEMREIEHSLCEWDKFERARLQDGKMKRKYNGDGQ